MYQRVGKAAYKADLKTTLELDEYFGKPHRNFKSIHIAGTNGKGSVSNMLASIFQQAGFKTGLYTSPHLRDFRERIRINGEMISQSYIVDFVENNFEIFENLKPSFFEMTVALAFKYFSDEKIDVAIIETGMGGRLDSTNIILPELSIITNISFDHTAFLGDTLEKIAAEKAGIIKKNVPVVIGEFNENTFAVFQKFADDIQTKIHLADKDYEIPFSLKTIDNYQVMQVYRKGELFLPDLKIPLLGNYQRQNVITLLCAFSILNKSFNISIESLRKGLENVIENTGFEGRWQILAYNPMIICDTAHNEAGLQIVMEQISNMNFKHLHIIIGVVNDKNIDGILELFPANATYYFTQAKIPRALPATELFEKARSKKLFGKIYSGVAEAIDAAKLCADPNDLIFIGGSTFIVAEAV